jgi:hypothetical protein
LEKAKNSWCDKLPHDEKQRRIAELGAARDKWRSTLSEEDKE